MPKPCNYFGNRSFTRPVMLPRWIPISFNVALSKLFRALIVRLIWTRRKKLRNSLRIFVSMLCDSFCAAHNNMEKVNVPYLFPQSRYAFFGGEREIRTPCPCGHHLLSKQRRLPSLFCSPNPSDFTAIPDSSVSQLIHHLFLCFLDIVHFGEFFCNSTFSHPTFVKPFST